MKKHPALLLLLLSLLSLLTLSAACAEAVVPLPAELHAALEPQLSAGWDVSDCLARFGDGPYFAAVTLRNERGDNRIVVLAEDAQGWQVQVKSDLALSRSAPVRLEDRSHTRCAGQQLGIAFSCIEDRVCAHETVWAWDDRAQQWLLRAYLIHDTDFSTILDTIAVQSTGLSYTGWRTEGRTVRYRGTVQTQLRYFDHSVFPCTPEEMQRKLTVAPDIPGGELTAQNIRFTGGRRYDVYSGPGEDYLRGGDGRAAVSTNDWVQVFGQEDGWMLIQYALSSDRMRFGWIPVEALPRGADVEPFRFSGVDAWTRRSVAVTDDPLASGAPLLTLPEGCRVAWLATMGDWAYIESSTGDLLRGFVPVEALRLDRVFDLAAVPSDSGPVFLGTLTVNTGTRLCSARVRLAPGAPLDADRVISFGFFDDTSGQWLSFADGTDWEGYYVASFPLGEDTTAIRILAQYADGSCDPDHAVVAAW